MLIKERNEWLSDFTKGHPVDEKVPIMTLYRVNRNTESFRTSRQLEILCEYILYLENELNRKKEKAC